MTLQEIIQRRILLKRQHVYLIGREIQALESDLHGLESDPGPAREVGVEQQVAGSGFNRYPCDMEASHGPS